MVHTAERAGFGKMVLWYFIVKKSIIMYGIHLKSFFQLGENVKNKHCHFFTAFFKTVHFITQTPC